MIAAMFRRDTSDSRKSAPRSPQANRNKPEHESATADRDPYLLSQVREAFGRVVYSHKVHEKQADICFVKYRWQQGTLIALTAISSGTFLAAAVDMLDSKTLTSLATPSIALLVTWMSLGVKATSPMPMLESFATSSKMQPTRSMPLLLGRPARHTNEPGKD